MRASILAFALVLCLNAKEIQLPDACSGSVCIEKMSWKKGVAEHTFRGTIITKTPIESIHLNLEFGDGQSSGNIPLDFRSVFIVQQFFFKVNAGGLLGRGLKWEHSHVHLTATAIHNVLPKQASGFVCSLDSKGSRLGLELVNGSGKDVVLDYSLLTLIAGTQNYKLNGAEGKYIDLDKPRPNVLIPAGTTHKGELIPMGAAKFVDGEWQEEWLIHQLLLLPDATLVLPFLVDGKTSLAKIPLQVTFTTVEVQGTVSQK